MGIWRVPEEALRPLSKCLILPCTPEGNLLANLFGNPFDVAGFHIDMGIGLQIFMGFAKRGTTSGARHESAHAGRETGVFDAQKPVAGKTGRVLADRTEVEGSLERDRAEQGGGGFGPQADALHGPATGAKHGLLASAATDSAQGRGQNMGAGFQGRFEDGAFPRLPCPDADSPVNRSMIREASSSFSIWHSAFFLLPAPERPDR